MRWSWFHLGAAALVLVACSSSSGQQPATTSSVSGKLTLSSFAKAPAAVDAVDETGKRTHGDVAPDGAFHLDLAKGHVYELLVVGPGFEEPIVFPRATGRLDKSFRISSGAAIVSLGSVRHYDSAPQAGFKILKLESQQSGQTGQGETADGEDGECVDGHLQGTNTPCVDDDDKTTCEKGHDDGNHDDENDGECDNGKDAKTGQACTDDDHDGEKKAPTRRSRCRCPRRTRRTTSPGAMKAATGTEKRTTTETEHGPRVWTVKLGVWLVCVLGTSSLAAHAAAAPEESGNVCEEPRVRIEGRPSERWLEAIARACDELSTMSDRDTSATVRMLPSDDDLIVEVVLADGRSALRRVKSPLGLRSALEALLTLPPANSPTPRAPAPPSTSSELPPAESPPPPPPKRPEHGLGVEIGLGVAGRVAGGEYASVAPTAQANLLAGAWLFGLEVRWDVATFADVANPAAFEMESVGAGLAVARRIALRALDLDIGFAPRLLSETQSFETNGNEQARTASDIRLASFMRGAFGHGPLRFMAALDVELSPAAESDVASASSPTFRRCPHGASGSPRARFGRRHEEGARPSSRIGRRARSRAVGRRARARPRNGR